MSNAAERWHETQLRVRYGETDQMGVVYHANYLVYMEEGRTRCMEALGAPYARIESAGVGLVVRKVSMRFRAPARYAQALTVRTRVTRLGAATVEFGYQILDSETAQFVCEGSTELACIDLLQEQRPPRMLPGELRQRLEAFELAAGTG